MTTKTATMCYLNEQSCYPEDNSNFGYKVHRNDGRLFLTFDAVLQSFGIKNRNGRYYEASNVMEAITGSEYIQTMLAQNSWVGEYDHPADPSTTQKLTIQRIANPDPKHSSHYIRQPRLEANLLKAPIQTDSSTEEGRSLAIKILDGKVVPAFSARVLGELKDVGGKPTVMVKRLITYDCVLFPSHPEAVAAIQQPVMKESKQEGESLFDTTVYLRDLAVMAASDSRETEWLCESFGLTVDDIMGLTRDGNVLIRENSNLYSVPLTDKVIRKKTTRALIDFIGGGK